jgi:hypothetical protein
MAFILNFNNSANDLQEAPSTNGVYLECGSIPISGTLTTNDPLGEVIDFITIDNASILFDSLKFDGSAPTTPYTVNFGTPVAVTFNIIPSGTVGNIDQIKIMFGLLPSGSQPFTYNITELSIKDSVTIPNNTLPLDFGTVNVGSFSNKLFVVNNETCIQYSYLISTDGEITFPTNPTVSFNLSPRSTSNVTATWTPTSAYDLSDYKIYCDTDCGNALYDLAGVSTEPPVGGAFSRKLIIANSISI